MNNDEINIYEDIVRIKKSLSPDALNLFKNYETKRNTLWKGLRSAVSKVLNNGNNNIYY